MKKYEDIKKEIIYHCGTMLSLCDYLGISRTALKAKMRGEYAFKKEEIEKITKVVPSLKEKDLKK